MQTRKLGYTDLHLTAIGLGTAAFGGGRAYGWAPKDDALSIATIHRALDLGINWLDTALFYGEGHAEVISGKAIASWQGQVVVATKCNVDRRRAGRPPRTIEQSIRRQAEASLRRLNREVIDLYQIHWPPKNGKGIEETWRVIADLVREGKVRYAGVSNFDLKQLQRVQAIHPVASLQPRYSMLNRDIEEELLPYCAANGIGVIVYSTMQSGLLTGKFTREYIAHLPPTDWRLKIDPNFREPRLSANLAFVERLRPIAERNGRSVGQLAIAWALRRPEVTAAIVGARTPAQIEEIASATDWTLSAEDTAEIDLLLCDYGENGNG